MKKSEEKRANAPPGLDSRRANRGPETGAFQRIFDDRSLLAQLHLEALAPPLVAEASIKVTKETYGEESLVDKTKEISHEGLFPLARAPLSHAPLLAPISTDTSRQPRPFSLSAQVPSSYTSPLSAPPSMPGAFHRNQQAFRSSHLHASNAPASHAQPLAPQISEGMCISGRYELETQLGVGNMGQVFLARDLRNGDVFALKVLHPWLGQDERIVELFTYEYMRMKRIDHPGIARTFALERDPHHKLWFLRMEYIGGISLQEQIHRKLNNPGAYGQPFSLSEAVQFFAKLVPILRFLHAQKLVHRDLKPSHIMWTQPDGTGDLKLLGFGMAAPLMQSCGSSLHLGQGYASLYTAPERMIQGEPATHATDIFSLGVMLYQMLTGALPIGMAAMPSALHPHLPTQLDMVLRRALEPQWSARFASVDEMFEAIKLAVATVFNATPPATPAPPTVRPSRPSARHQTVSIRKVRFEDRGNAPPPPGSPAKDPVSNATRLSRMRRQLAHRVNQASSGDSSSHVPAKEPVCTDQVAPRMDPRRALSFQSQQLDITELAFSPDGCFLASASSDATIKLWEVPSWYLLHTIELGQGQLQHLCWSPLGKCLAYSCGREVFVRDVMHPERQNTLLLDSACQALSWRSDGNALIIATQQGAVQIWEPSSVFLPRQTVPKEFIHAIATPQQMNVPPYHLMPQHLALIGGGNGYIALWDLLEDEIICQFSDPGSTLSALALHPRDTAFLSGNTRGEIQFWEPQFQGQTRAWKAHDGPICHLEMSRHGEWFISADREIAHMWRTSDGEKLASFSPQSHPLRTLALSPDSQWLALDDQRDHIKLWDISSWNPHS